VIQVPWADHDARTTRSFDDQVGWLVVHCNRTAVSELMRISWRTVGWITARVSNRLRKGTDPLASLRRIGIDEISFRRGHKYLIVVVDMDTGTLVWAAEGRDKKTLQKFFTELGEERCALITHVSADAGSWIAAAVRASCPDAVRCMDPFHVVQWVTEALDKVRSEVLNGARRAGHKHDAAELRRSRWALWKGGDHLTDHQQAKLDWIERTNEPLYRAYLLKEQLRLVFQLPSEHGLALLDEWIEWAENSDLKPFARVAGTIYFHRDAIRNSLIHGMSNAKTEGLNTRIRLLTRRSFGFHSAAALIGLAMLCFGRPKPQLPGRI
jgi:transposase